MINVHKIHTHRLYGFRFAQITGTGDNDHASAWSFDDEQIVRDRHWHMKPGELVLDIGAAFGSYALPALSMGARVIAFNPADFDAELMQYNLDLNPELAKRCEMVRDGIYGADGWFDPDHCQFTPSGEGLFAAECPGPRWLKVRSLDSFISDRGIDRVDWIKMDIEGAEFEALKGAEQCLRRWTPKLLIECHEFHDKQLPRKVHGFLTGLGVGYVGESHPHCAVSHSYYEVRR